MGDATLEYLDNRDEIFSSDMKAFRETCQSWWCTATKVAPKELPMELPLLRNIQCLQPSLQQYSYLTRFKLLLNYYLRLQRQKKVLS